MRHWIMASALGLAACGQGGGPAPQASPTTAANGKDFRQEVANLPEAQRKIVFLRAILDANQTCQGIGNAVRQPDQDGRFVWLAQCTGGAAWLVALAADGNAGVTGPIGAKTVPAGQATPG